jgi:hypothetical protein
MTEINYGGGEPCNTTHKPESGQKLSLGLVTTFEGEKEIVSYNDAVIFIKDPIDETGDDETEITITTTNFSAISIAKKIVGRFNGE